MVSAKSKQDWWKLAKQPRINVMSKGKAAKLTSWFLWRHSFLTILLFARNYARRSTLESVNLLLMITSNSTAACIIQRSRTSPKHARVKSLYHLLDLARWFRANARYIRLLIFCQLKDHDYIPEKLHCRAHIGAIVRVMSHWLNMKRSILRMNVTNCARMLFNVMPRNILKVTRSVNCFKRSVTTSSPNQIHHWATAWTFYPWDSSLANFKFPKNLYSVLILKNNG